MVVAGMSIHTAAAVVHQGGHTLEVLASRRDYDGFSS